MPFRQIAAGALLLTTMIAVAASEALAQTPSENWPAVKCARYKEGYKVAIARQGKQGLGPEFLARHDAFLASDCAGEHDVCPRSGEELALANTLVILGMNQGMASTFMPFACRK